VISLDSDIVLSALNPKDANHGRAIAALNQYSSQALCLSPVVRAELLASASWPAINAWLELQGVAIIWEMPESVWDSAGQAFGQYARLRKLAPAPRRLVANFLIAADAHFHELDMLTFDDTVFTSVFPSVTLLPV
jgi:predicted nucleic acid-binding protein